MSAARFRLAPWERHVDVAELVDLEALSHCFHATNRLEESAQTIRGYAEDFEVEILIVAAEQAVANPPSNDQRPASGIPDRRGDRMRTIQTHVSSVHVVELF